MEGALFFNVLAHGVRIPADAKNKAFLLTDNWDDWFKFNTMYVLIYFDQVGESTRIGEVKIGEFAMEKDQRRPNIPTEFNHLDEAFFSLGQDVEYYETLNRLGNVVRDRILAGLNDVARDQALFARALSEDVTGVSLLRSVPRSSVTGQFHRIATGGVRLTRYAFSYHTPPTYRSQEAGPIFKFKVQPESEPPTNVHVLIGRNGVGKTHNLNRMTQCLVEESPDAAEVGQFVNDEVADDILGEQSNPIFSNLVSVTFSAFDPFEPIPIRQNKAEGVRYNYIGLKYTTPQEDGSPRPPKGPEDLGRDFAASVWLILNQKAKLLRWISVLSILESDPIFKRTALTRILKEFTDEELGQSDTEARKSIQKTARTIFRKLSSGHKIVLMTLTRLVETVEERTLVLLDEPEAHLHPPLLSALVRSLSFLLIDRNGVAIVATHSPVVLQEVPRKCVWKIRRVGRELKIRRPKIQTFGENVGVLTGEIFGLEVTDSGFHRLIAKAVDDGLSYEDAVERFDGQLGDEARMIVRSLIAERDGASPDDSSADDSLDDDDDDDGEE